jgi:hypothetical protein
MIATATSMRVWGGRWKMEDGRWKMEDGGWRMEGGGWRMEERTTSISCLAAVHRRQTMEVERLTSL